MLLGVGSLILLVVVLVILQYRRKLQDSTNMVDGLADVVVEMQCIIQEGIPLDDLRRLLRSRATRVEDTRSAAMLKIRLRDLEVECEREWARQKVEAKALEFEEEEKRDIRLHSSVMISPPVPIPSTDEASTTADAAP